MKFPSLPGWRRSSHAAAAPVSTPVLRQGPPAAPPPGLVPRTHRPPAQVSGPVAVAAQPAPQPPRQATPVRGTATLDKLATLLARPEPAGAQPMPARTKADQAVPSGDGWGMAILRQPAERQALLFKLADDRNAAGLEVVTLLSRKPDLEVPDDEGKTVLLRAAWAQNAGMVKALVNRGADVHVADARGLTALHMAAASPDDDRVRLMMSGLLEARADVQAQNMYGMTPLFAADSKVAVDLLLKNGAAIDHRDRLGNTALTYAAMTWKPHAMLALLEHGADPQVTNEAGRSFIDMVRDHYDLDEDATLPQQPAALADYIARREVEPAQSLPTAARMPVPTVEASPRKPINSLKSGHKIALVDRPHAGIEELNPQDLNALSLALGFGPISQSTEEGQAQCVSIWKTLDAFAQDVFDGFAHHDNEGMQHPGLLSGRSRAEQQELKAAMDTAHMYVAAPLDLRGRFIPGKLKIFFGGSQNRRDSSVDRAARRIGELLAKQMESDGNQVRIERIAGASMGGACAQTMLATLQSRVQLDEQPSMLLLDPQLLNNRQAARATRDGTLAVDYRIPRGVAISLDYTKAPHRGLMGVMKGPGGYTYPGLVHLKLGLTDTDGVKGTAPKGLPGLGYHSDFRPYGLALARLLGTATHRIPVLFRPRPPPRWPLERPASRPCPGPNSSAVPAGGRRIRTPCRQWLISDRLKTPGHRSWMSADCPRVGKTAARSALRASNRTPALPARPRRRPACPMRVRAPRPPPPSPQPGRRQSARPGRRTWPG